MKNVVIVHGKPTKERYENPELPKPHEANWLPWLARELGRKGINAALPAMPKPYFPEYRSWRGVFSTLPVSAETGLVGHSAGTEFLLRWLSEQKDVRVEALALVAPYHDHERKYGDFSEYTLDETIGRRVGKITIFSSLDDSEPIQGNARRLAESLPGSHLTELDGYGHFMLGNKMESPEFPELLDTLTGK